MYVRVRILSIPRATLSMWWHLQKDLGTNEINAYLTESKVGRWIDRRGDGEGGLNVPSIVPPLSIINLV